MIPARLVVPVAAIVVAATCVRLGFWQLGKHHAREARNRTARASLALPRAVLDGTDSMPAYRRVTAAGRWDGAHELILRQQTMNGVPGVTLVTPLVLNGSGRSVLVVRGFVPTPDGMWAPEARHPVAGADTVEGTTLALGESPGGGRPLVREGVTTWATLDRSALAARLGSALLPLYLVETDTTGAPHPRRLTIPPLDAGPFLSYTIQWFSFATVALVGAWLWGRRQRQQPAGPRRDPTLPPLS